MVSSICRSSTSRASYLVCGLQHTVMAATHTCPLSAPLAGSKVPPDESVGFLITEGILGAVEGEGGGWIHAEISDRLLPVY